MDKGALIELYYMLIADNYYTIIIIINFLNAPSGLVVWQW